MEDPPRAPDDRPIYDIWLSLYRFPSLTVADEIGLFASLDAEAATPRELARRLDANLRGVEVLLGIMSSLGLLTVAGERYRLTDTARTYLLPTSRFYWGGVLHVMRQTVPQHAQMLAALRATRPADAPELNRVDRPIGSWAAGAIDLEPARVVARIMQSLSLPAALALARDPSFADVRRLLDVGGGSGCYSIALAQAHARLECTVLDLPAMCEVALANSRSAGVAERVHARPVDMLREPWPPGHDAVLLSNILHDWDAATCRHLAGRAYASLPPGGRIFVHEVLLDDDGSGPLPAAAYSVAMLLTTEGRQLSFSEVAGILGAAGFTDAAVAPAHGHFSLVRARRPPKNGELQ